LEAAGAAAEAEAGAEAAAEAAFAFLAFLAFFIFFGAEAEASLEAEADGAAVWDIAKAEAANRLATRAAISFFICKSFRINMLMVMILANQSK
jgi:hypothetical protein